MLIIDVSSNNHAGSTSLDWSRLAGQGVQGCVVKLTEADYENPYAKADLHDAEVAGLACLGSYDFARQDVDSGARDAELYLDGLNAIGGMRPGWRHALDVEEHGGSGPQVDPYADLAAYALDWARIIWPTQSRHDTQLRPLLYSRRQYLIDHHLVDNPALDATFDLWLVRDGNPNPPSGWSRVAMWQDGQRSFAGATGPVDCNTFVGLPYDWLSKSWGYQTWPTNTPIPPDVDPSLDTPAILRHVAESLQSIHADVSLLITRGGLIG